MRRASGPRRVDRIGTQRQHAAVPHRQRIGEAMREAAEDAAA
jgi:hypothetical protein